MCVIYYECGRRAVPEKMAKIMGEILGVDSDLIVGVNQKIEISEAEFCKVFAHYVRHKNDLIEIKQTDFLRRKIIH